MSQPETQRSSKVDAVPAGNPTTVLAGKKPRTLRKHAVEPVPAEYGRYYVDSFSDPNGRYIVDVMEGTCPCKGFSVRKFCSHLTDATDVHEKREAVSNLPPVVTD